MRRRSMLGKLATVLAILLPAACASLSKPQPDELVPPLCRLTMAAQIVILFPEGGKPLPDEGILEAALNEKPELRPYFQGLPIKIRQNGKDVVVLVCSPDGKHAWLEDASWTPGVDREWYAVDPNHPAEFSLDPSMARGN